MHSIGLVSIDTVDDTPLFGAVTFTATMMAELMWNIFSYKLSVGTTAGCGYLGRGSLKEIVLTFPDLYAARLKVKVGGCL